jgi:hypothetical protein
MNELETDIDTGLTTCPSHKPQKFWMIAAHNTLPKFTGSYGDETAPPRVKFATREDAQNAAQMMSAKTTNIFYVLEVVDAYAPLSQVRKLEL